MANLSVADRTYSLQANTMTSIGAFPFGQPVKEVKQEDRTKKDVFVLGVYASAVHARWIAQNNRTIIKALAVASEPYIFWHGDNIEAENIIHNWTLAMK